MINIGLVYDSLIKQRSGIKSLINYFEENGTVITISKISLDKDGENWLISSDSDLENFFSLQYYYGEISMSLKVFSTLNDISLNINIYNEQDFYGVLLKFNEAEFEQKDLDIDETETILINFIKAMAEKLNFKYSFCDYDGEIDFHPDDQKNIEKEYSIVYWPNKNKLIKNNWKIDGVSSR